MVDYVNTLDGKAQDRYFTENMRVNSNQLITTENGAFYFVRLPAAPAKNSPIYAINLATGLATYYLTGRLCTKMLGYKTNSAVSLVLSGGTRDTMNLPSK